MSELAEAAEASRDLQEILDLLTSAGFEGGRVSSTSPQEKVAAGLAWCINAARRADQSPPGDQPQVWEAIEAGLNSMSCPYPLPAHHIQGLDYRNLYPVVQWIVNTVLAMRPQIINEENSSYPKVMVCDQQKFEPEEGRKESRQMQQDLFVQTADSFTEEHLRMDKHSVQHSVEAPAVSSMSNLADKLMIPLNLEDESMVHQKDKKKPDLLSEIQKLHQQIDETCCSNTVQELIRMLELLKALERQESDLQSVCKQKHSDMQSEILKLEKEKSAVNENKSGFIDLNYSLSDSSNKLSSAKRELASKLREILSLKRQLDNVPAQSELIQYERRFSELYVQIQEKHRQTRKHYATYNALLEIKELMLKEISLLNSINSQFHDAITSTTGRSKLVDSMEVIVKGTQQKLEKVQLSLLAEQKNCDSLKEKYTAAIAEQRHFSSLLKAFQEECARNERLRRLAAI